MNGTSSTDHIKSHKPIMASMNSTSIHNRHKKKYLMYKRYARALVFENGALCDEVAHTQSKIFRAKEERRFLLKKLLNFKERLEHFNQRPSSPSTDVAFSNLNVNHQASDVARSKKKHSPKKKKDEADSSKPRRRKPMPIIKKVTHPIPLDSMGRPVFPIALGELTIYSIGEVIPDRPRFHDENHIYPVGYCSTRMFAGIKDFENKCMYTCKISDGEAVPKFEIAADNNPEYSFVGDSASECYVALLNTIKHARGQSSVEVAGKGPEFFGLSHPMVKNLIQSCQGARKCSKYQWIKFEIIRPELNQSTPSELESDTSLSQEVFSQNLLKIKEEPKDPPRT